ncbi:MAG: hypothetical protein K8R92_11985 [Planctomycetes bacterium]|nr:hypothetical protein [Planctomycetota bacterium]
MKNFGSMTSALLAISFAGAAGASDSGVQGLYARNYIVQDTGVSYSVMDIFLKFNSNVGTGNNGERVVNFFGQATTDTSTYGVNKTSKFENTLGIAFQHSNLSWLPGSATNGGTGNNTWDSFVTVGCRTQGAGYADHIIADPYFLNPQSNVGSILGGSSGPRYVGAGFAGDGHHDPDFATNTSAYSDHMIMMGRFTLKISDIISSGGAPKMVVWCDFVGKSTSQTGGTTLYSLLSANVRSDAQTMYTTSGNVWTFDSSFDGVNEGQEAWTFAGAKVDIPGPGVATLLGLAGLGLRRRRHFGG